MVRIVTVCWYHIVRTCRDSFLQSGWSALCPSSFDPFGGRMLGGSKHYDWVVTVNKSDFLTFPLLFNALQDSSKAGSGLVLFLFLCFCHLAFSSFSVGCPCLLLLVFCFFVWSSRLFSSWLKFPSFYSLPPPPYPLQVTSTVKTLTDDEIFKACGGRRLHRGARRQEVCYWWGVLWPLFLNNDHTMNGMQRDCVVVTGEAEAHARGWQALFRQSWGLLGMCSWWVALLPIPLSKHTTHTHTLSLNVCETDLYFESWCGLLYTSIYISYISYII